MVVRQTHIFSLVTFTTNYLIQGQWAAAAQTDALCRLHHPFAYTFGFIQAIQTNIAEHTLQNSVYQYFAFMLLVADISQSKAYKLKV
jgi:hypothetical protein